MEKGVGWEYDWMALAPAWGRPKGSKDGLAWKSAGDLYRDSWGCRDTFGPRRRFSCNLEA